MVGRDFGQWRRLASRNNTKWQPLCTSSSEGKLAFDIWLTTSSSHHRPKRPWSTFPTSVCFTIFGANVQQPWPQLWYSLLSVTGLWCSHCQKSRWGPTLYYRDNHHVIIRFALGLFRGDFRGIQASVLLYDLKLQWVRDDGSPHRLVLPSRSPLQPCGRMAGTDFWGPRSSCYKRWLWKICHHCWETATKSCRPMGRRHHHWEDEAHLSSHPWWMHENGSPCRRLDRHCAFVHQSQTSGTNQIYREWRRDHLSFGRVPAPLPCRSGRSFSTSDLSLEAIR